MTKSHKWVAIAGVLLALAALGAFLLLRDQDALPSGSALLGVNSPASASPDEVALGSEKTEGEILGAAPPTSKRRPTVYDPQVARDLEKVVLRDELPTLFERAKREPSLAHALAQALVQCRMADSSYKSLAASAGAMGGTQKLEERMAEFDRVFSKCKGMQDSTIEMQYELITTAAKADLLEAQLAYRAYAGEFVLSSEALRRPEVAREYHNNVIAFTTRAAASGRPAALMNAFSLYSDGYLVPPDRVAAYRYLRAYVQAQPGPSSQKLLSQFTSQMTADELKRATAQ